MAITGLVFKPVLDISIFCTNVENYHQRKTWKTQANKQMLSNFVPERTKMVEWNIVHHTIFMRQEKGLRRQAKILFYL